MKRIIRFSRGNLTALVFSLLVVTSGIAGYFSRGGFNLGIDFRAGLIQEIQLAPRAFSLSYTGPGNAVISMNNTVLSIAISGVGVKGETYNYVLGDYNTLGSFVQGVDQIEGIAASSGLPGSTLFRHLVLDALSAPSLGEAPYWIHYLPADAPAVAIEDVRSALSGLGEPAVQVLGEGPERRFMIRLQDSDIKGDFNAAGISSALDRRFGEGETAVTSSNYVGSRFSKNLTSQAFWLLGATLLLILIYASIRFRPQYATGAVLAIVHDALVMVAFIVWTRMEFNTTTIAAILTILGYSINDTIVIFDRIRETRRIYPGDSFEIVMNRSITETLGRTFITTLTTMLAVVSLYVFTTGAMKDFALALLVGLVSGVYSTIFIACGFVSLWEKKFKRSAAAEPAETGT
ncbi:MAG: protein translocase subunit SecF [Treponema sp.]|jgi:preprotein translocase subunit SecF|nr:protein translocase subunit SecF [Treponema sp.]